VVDAISIPGLKIQTGGTQKLCVDLKACIFGCGLF
jgi:hypothetical protein